MSDELIVVGSSSAIPTQRRFPSAYALNVTGKLFLVDCGAPVSTLLYRYNLDPIEVEAIFLSHWHIDHVANLGLLLSHNHQRRRSRKLQVYGPRGTRGKIWRLLNDSFMLPENLSYKLKATNIKPGIIYKQALLRTTFFETQHLDRPELKTHFGNKAIACGMILNGPGWRIVYSGDLASPDELAPYVKNCDLLIHEMAHHPPEVVARFAESAKIPHVLVSHIDPKFDDTPEKIEKAFAKHYSGNLIVAADGVRISLEQLKQTSKPRTRLTGPDDGPGQLPAYPEQEQAENPNTIFVHKLQKEFSLSAAVSHQILQTAQEVLVGQTATPSGQVGVVVASLNAPANAPLTYMDRVEVTLTIDAGAEDAEVETREGVTGLRRGRILRLLEEALEQDGVLTQEDLAWILNVNVRTIRRDIQSLKDEGHLIYTRGQLNADDPIRLYKVKAVEMWLKNQDIDDIACWLHQSPWAVKQYIATFKRAATLYQQGKVIDEISALVPASARLTEGYIALYQKDKSNIHAKLQQDIMQTEEQSNG